MANDGSLPPKVDLTRIEDFDPTKEPAPVPDLGALLGLTPSPAPDAPADPSVTSTSQPTDLELTRALTSRTEAQSEPAGQPASDLPSFQGGPIQDIKRFSEQMSVAKELVPAAFPFSVMIDGQLQPEEKERLTDLLNRENLGIRPMDLEPQLEEGRVLIPRISEYAAVLIVQALRSTQAKIRLGPSDEIFSTEATRTESDELIAPHLNRPVAADFDATHRAERMPVTPESSLAELGPYVVIDIVTASALLSVQAVEAVRSTEYNEMIESLQRELRFKAWRKGATAILNFSIQLNLLSLPSRYRVLVTGSAVRSAAASVT